MAVMDYVEGTFGYRAGPTPAQQARWSDGEESVSITPSTCNDPHLVRPQVEQVATHSVPLRWKTLCAQLLTLAVQQQRGKQP